MPGTFSFFSGERRSPEQMKTEPLKRNGQDLLFNALQIRDEFTEVERRMPNRQAIVHRRQLNISWPEKAPQELRPLAEEVWQIVYSKPLTLSELFRNCSACELKLYLVVDELVRSQHFDLCSPPSSAEQAA
jgi:hypothetical protein